SRPQEPAGPPHPSWEFPTRLPAAWNLLHAPPFARNFCNCLISGIRVSTAFLQLAGSLSFLRSRQRLASGSCFLGQTVASSEGGGRFKRYAKRSAYFTSCSPPQVGGAVRSATSLGIRDLWARKGPMHGGRSAPSCLPRTWICPAMCASS